ncbi:MAG TPA: carbamoyltransferase C-terminal domain-containing protein, partial [Bryobacteraceae bacterium]|nr:carbamoyltransferase C-terminal domain-containing protein [Bryobacteraceae bacterium]
TMTNRRFGVLFGGPARQPSEPLTQRHMDLAASIQDVLEHVLLTMTRALAAETGAKNLCLAGGVALNCVANGRILRDGKFQGVWIQPAAGDAGGALGAALAGYHIFGAQQRTPVARDAMQGSYLGPSFSSGEVVRRLEAAGARFLTMDEDCLIRTCVDALLEGQALGWFQGRMEFGPRALGARSILGDARSPTMQTLLNLKVKFRESFRPFAPSVLYEDVQDWFELDGESPYMLFVAGVLKDRRRALTPEEEALFGIEKLKVPRSDIPAVTHVDYSARVQTVRPDWNPRYYALLSAFKARTGCPLLVNTSFNVRGEPIVCTPEDAFRCFMGTGIECLVIENCFLRKSEQRRELRSHYANTLAAD